ncbi:cold-shock protein [Heyndrickxia coagulans]|uniref:cold-shock protein n=1 Tax=Heyndrickxia coagulans TaxID=1398 RepID=UPI000E4AEBA0|nr:cold-shock protein [Heyndrickxia coagulans]MEC5268809.1 cold-shock protein [Heyndrickxia coagulans]MED4940863.1 cold-shock protein [Heyndrickxia coagulans]MED4965722.1 cold-shock protein [Heyndrickxia coagulans]RGR87305.1 cold-shock protein [Heyndrickxia coagulans]RGR99468.1 cold-shock protein [Heyndrickxia coagulans]
MMAYFNNQKEPVPEVETTVWACSNDDCNGFMRENFTFEEKPHCPLCHSDMKKEVRVLPVIGS